MIAFNINLYLFLENFLFFLCATSFFVVVGWAWKHTKLFSIPKLLPGWFALWFGSVQILGGLLPLVVMLLWGVLWGYASVLSILSWYFVMLALQILSETISVRLFHNVAWVMIPYLYVPYRVWQMYEGLTLLGSASELFWVKNLFFLEILLWIVNYALDLSQLPRLFRWEINQSSDISIN
ncbi:MAG: hypothetical protein KME59_23330 [Trichormus sp. ATA11-4-KO1]|nr:hypothetical protein [Trichormus sp. ATA11-4-KO1]